VEKIIPAVGRSSRSQLVDRAGPRVRFAFPAIVSTLLSALLLLHVIAPAYAEQAHPAEAQVKAAYLYNFGKFVTWPEGSPTKGAHTFGICVLGKDPFGATLDSTVAGESINGKKITVSRPARIQDASECNVLFISASEEGHLASILAVAQRFGALTVSDMPHFAERGGTVGFVTSQGRIRFEVNLRAAEQSHLTLGSELLKVASAVIDKPAGQP
jgi:YfiR/HmsC-like